MTKNQPTSEGQMDTESMNISQNLPGEPAKKRLAEIIRVDHAGEYGAVRIYQGQLAVLRARKAAPETIALVEEMAAQEEEHLATFNTLIKERRVRPTALSPLWHLGGFAMGAASALFGDKAAMACTAAVEDVIDHHYEDQIDFLELQGETELKDIVEQCRQEEIAHKEKALEKGAEDAPAYPILSQIIKTTCRAAIKVSEKI